MRLMAIDSSAKAASVCILEDENILGEFFINTKLTHSQTLMPMVDSLLESTQIKLKDIDAFAVSAGPGSFTGIRIGISIIKGMALALDKPCIAVSTLEAMAYNFIGNNCTVISTMDARRNQVYNAIFKVSANKISRLTDDRAISIEELNKEIKLNYNKENLILVGDGAQLCYNSFDKIGLSIALAAEHVRYQHASGVSMVAFNKAKNNDFVSCDELIPIYLRQSQAERLRNKEGNL